MYKPIDGKLKHLYKWLKNNKLINENESVAVAKAEVSLLGAN